MTGVLSDTLWGRVPEQHRTDSLSAAFGNLDADAKRDLTERYDALCANYGMIPTRNTLGFSLENGSIESSHGHLKKKLEDALLLRASGNFEDLASSRGFVDAIIAHGNARNAKRIDQERAALKAVPDRKSADYEEVLVDVTSCSAVTPRKVFYLVHSQQIGQRLRIHLHDDRLECFRGSTLVLALRRGRPDPSADAAARALLPRPAVSPVRRSPGRSTRCWRARGKNRLVAPWSGFSRSRMNAPAQPNSPSP